MRGRIHPLVDMVLDILASHASIYGDGVKRILLMLNYFLKRLNRPHFLPEAETKWRCELNCQISLFKQNILPELVHRLQMEDSRIAGANTDTFINNHQQGSPYLKVDGFTLDPPILLNK